MTSSSKLPLSPVILFIEVGARQTRMASGNSIELGYHGTMRTAPLIKIPSRVFSKQLTFSFSIVRTFSCALTIAFSSRVTSWVCLPRSLVSCMDKWEVDQFKVYRNIFMWSWSNQGRRGILVWRLGFPRSQSNKEDHVCRLTNSVQSLTCIAQSWW